MDIPKVEDLALVHSYTKVSWNGCPIGARLWLFHRLIRTQNANPMAHFAKLPAELHLHIASKCSFNALAALCRTSRLLHTRFTKNMYEEFDLGHRASRITGGVYYKQSNFLRTLKRHPEYAGYVQSLKWALVVKEPEDLVDSLARLPSYSNLPYLPSYSKCKPLGILEILLLLTEVISVKIDQGDTDQYPRAMIPQGLSLFPKATSISMFGILADTFVHAVLPVVKGRQLQHLNLCHVQLEAPGEDCMEPTIRLLNSLTGRCTSLKSLAIVESDHHIYKPCSALDKPTTATAYLEFLKSVKETLVTFKFICKDYGIIDPDVPSDDVWKLKRSIHQVLRRGPWPQLQNVTFRLIRDGWLGKLYGDWEY